MIPLELVAKEMFDEFKRFGDIDEVVVPSKQDIRGHCYGFIRFSVVKSEGLLATKLDNIFIGRRFFF